METTSIIAVIIFSALTGFLFGGSLGYITGKKRSKLLIAYLANRMEQLRTDHVRKVKRMNIAAFNKDDRKVDYLTRELLAESTVFNDIQHAISDWCINNNEKDPFAL